MWFLFHFTIESSSSSSSSTFFQIIIRWVSHMISYISRICFLCTTTPSVFFCQGGHNDICTILAVKKFGSSPGVGSCPPSPPPLIWIVNLSWELLILILILLKREKKNNFFEKLRIFILLNHGKHSKTNLIECWTFKNSTIFRK